MPASRQRFPTGALLSAINLLFVFCTLYPADVRCSSGVFYTLCQISFMRYLLLSFTLVFGISFSHAQEWKTFTDTAGFFTASYPDTWVAKIKENNHVFFTSPAESDDDKFRQNINIIINASEELKGYGIRDLAPDLLESLKTQYDNYKPVSNRYFTWNDKEAFEVVYQMTLKGDSTQYQIKQWMYLGKGVLYVITYTAPPGADAMAETAVKIMTSIHL